jgi:homoserine kinase type II
MGIYSEIDLEEINQILNYYEFGSKAKSFKATIEGTSNSNYKVTLEDDINILLKISNDKTLEQLTNEQTILQVLEKYQYKYSIHPIKTISGKSIYQHNGHYGVLFPFIDGVPPVITTHSCFQVGAALAHLHSLEIHSEDLNSIRPHTLVGYGGMSVYEYCHTSLVAPEDFKESFATIFPDQLQDIPYDIFPVGIIHGDLYYDNSLFKGDDIVCLIDFEQAGRGRFILDLGIAISGTCLNDSKDNISLELMNSFVEGYQSVRKLITIEREYLKTAILVGFFSIGLWRIKRFYEGNLDPAKKNNYQELLARAHNFNQVKVEV